MDWTVRAMDDAARRRAADAADAAGLTLAEWLDRAILDNAATYVPPPAWALRGKSDATEDTGDESDEALVDPQAQDKIRLALEAVDSRLQRADRNIAGVVTPLTRKIDAIADRAVAPVAAHAPAAPPPLPPISMRQRRYRRGLGAIAALLLLISAAGAGGLVWLWFETQEPPPNRFAEMTEEELLRVTGQTRPRAGAATRPAPPSSPASPASPPVSSTVPRATAGAAPAEFADLEALIAKSREGNLADETADTATSNAPAVSSTVPPATSATSEAAPDIAAKPAAIEEADSANLSGEALIERLRARAAANDAKAQHDLALVLMEGRLLARDPNTAGELFEKAAMQGLANAQYNLGVIYDQGIGRAADPTMAFFWYSAAADQGHVPAQYNLGVALAQGRGTVRDYNMAANWFERAAKTGLPDAEFNLGQLYENGYGVTQDLKRAFELYRAAAAKGYAPANQRLVAVQSRLDAQPPAASATPTPTPTPTTAAPAAAPAGPLTNKEVAELQTLLQKLSLLKAKPDGMLGPATTAAVRDYQTMAGLRQTGVPTRELLSELRDVARR